MAFVLSYEDCFLSTAIYISTMCRTAFIIDYTEPCILFDQFIATAFLGIGNWDGLRSPLGKESDVVWLRLAL